LQANGQLDQAIASYQMAIRLKPDLAEAHNNLGNAFKSIGQLDQAVLCYRQAIRLRSDLAEAHNNLGNALKIKGQLDEAIAACRQAVRLKPHLAEAHTSLGNALTDIGQLDEAISSYRQTVRLRPDLAEAHCNLGIALTRSGQPRQAIASYYEAIRLKLDFAEAHSNLGIALTQSGQPHRAIAAYNEAIRLKPDYAVAHSNLGLALAAIGQFDEALASHRVAIRLNPDSAESQNNLGITLASIGQFEEAIAVFRQPVQLKPDCAEAYSNLGNALLEIGQTDEAITACRRAIRLKPDYAAAHNNLGNALKEIGALDEAIACYQQAVRHKPDYVAADSNRVFTLHFHPRYDAGTILQECRLWNERHVEPFRNLRQPHDNNRDQDRRLRIGYVSPDFRGHCQSLFTIPLLSNHDRQAFEIFCYSHVAWPDPVTEHVRRFADVWQSIVGMTDANVAGKIREDRIDILIDLTMHMASNRLPIFARKSAPVQVAWLAYPGTTGLAAMDYRLTDPHLDPPGLNDHFYSETSIRLPETFWCYDPRATDLAVSALPAQTNGHITFGCLNNFCKVNDRVVQLWAEVLKAVDGSRLMILCHEGRHRQSLLDILKREGVHPDRIEWATRRPRREYLELYHRIDIGLDTFPYNGHTTSLDSYWMGVPVVTLVGPTVVGRAGLSQLTNLELKELTAHTPRQYVQIAAALAGDLPKLADLRRTLRLRMQASPLMDAPRFARGIEAAYRQMWRRWCAAQ
jgi:predicted O-linked N-acetylglucosamine transferase (SPINDLY family)